MLRRKILIVDADPAQRRALRQILAGEYEALEAESAQAAISALRGFPGGISAVILKASLSDESRFEALRRVRADAVVTRTSLILSYDALNGEEEAKALEQGANGFLLRPYSASAVLYGLHVCAAMKEQSAAPGEIPESRAGASEGSGEAAKYRAILESTGTVVVDYDWPSGVFAYDRSISAHIAGKFDERKLWHILMSDMVAEAMDVKAMQGLLFSVATDRRRTSGSMRVLLKTPIGEKQWFLMRVFKRAGDSPQAAKLYLTFVNINEEVRSEEALRYQAERDALTGLYNRTAFLNKADRELAAHKPGHFILASFNIDNFKLINDQFGSEKGDEILIRIAKVFQAGFESVGGIVGRITADNFAVLYPASFASSVRIGEIREEAVAREDSLPRISFRVGRYLADDISLSASAMYDRAVLAEESIKGRFDANIALYDESMRRRILREQEIVGEMRQALKDDQFVVWLQPQYNRATGALIGAEALARWAHPAKGLMPPGEFIPIFEKNGFIYEMDKYIWERSCQLLRKWIDMGSAPMPVSVNISRYDLFREDLTDRIVGLIRKYCLSPELLRLEITESALAESTDRIIGVVKGLIERGFTIEIDDFGSGYSSLNTLKDVPAQVLKMDMRFLESGSHTDRGGNILESVVRMARWLGMAVIAEGVETNEQADFLASIGCGYMQGYLYAKPMQIEQYEALLAGAGAGESLLAMETVENWDNNAFWDPKSMDTLLFNTYVGGACIFEWHNERIEILRVNEKYAKTIGGEARTMQDALNLVWEDHMDEAAAKATRDAISRAIETGDDATYEAAYADLFGVRGITYLRTTFRVIARASNRYLIYSVNVNLTAQREAEQSFRVAASVGGRAIARYDIRTGTYYHSDKTLMALGFPEKVENVPQSFVDAGNVAPEYVAEYLEFYDKIRRGERFCALDCPIRAENGGFRWIRQDATVAFDADGKPSQAVIVISDIAEQREKDAAYQKWRRSLKQRPNDMYTLYRCNLAKNPSLDSVEGSLLNVRFSPEAKTFDERTREYALASVFAEDREGYTALLDKDALLAAFRGGSRIQPLEYREIRPDGSLRWLRLTVELVQYENSADIEAYLMYEDIDAAKRAALIDKERAQTDPLTGIFNRRAFVQVAMEKAQGADAAKRSAFLMLDIDDFKRVNDTFGHAAGDRALVDTAKALRGVLRRGDVLGRFGGDEFLICLPDMPDDGAISRKADGIRKALNRRIGADMRVTASIGIAVYPRDGAEYETLYRKMDAALYSVKNSGKNGFAFFDSSLSSLSTMNARCERLPEPSASQDEDGGAEKSLLCDE